MSGYWAEIADLTGRQGPAGGLSRGIIPAGSNIDLWNTASFEGSWVINSTNTAGTISGIPIVAAGQLLNLPGIGFQVYTAYGPEPTIWFRGINNLAAQKWGPWTDFTSRKTTITPNVIPQGVNLNDWHLADKAGVWNVNSTATAQTIKNLPVPQAGQLDNRSVSMGFQTYMTYGAEPGYWFRGITNLATKAWSPWVNLLAGQASDSAGGLNYAVRSDSARKRVGYKLGTGGKAVVMLRFDDNPASFQSKVLPVLRANDLPGYLATTVRWVEEIDRIPWETVQGWSINDGLQVWSHSWTHSAASTKPQLQKEIIQSADYFEEKMPRVKIDGWVMPGTGVDGDPYDGYNGKLDTEFFGTYAGQLILSRYGIVNAAKAGYYQPMGGHPIGQTHQTMDAWDVATFKEFVRTAQQGGHALSIMLHPEQLDSAGKMTTAQFRECMEWLAAEREGGRLMMLTGNAAVALDPDSNHRDNLLPGTFGGSLRGWTGWTLNAAGNPETSGTTPLTFTFPTLQYGWARGGTREAHALVKASAAAVVRVSVTGSGVEATKTYNIPAGKWVDVRKFFTIPVNASNITVSLTRVSGGTVQTHQINAYAA